MSATESKSKDDNNHNLVVGKQLSLCKHVGFTPFACFVCLSEDQSHYLWISFVFKIVYIRGTIIYCVFSTVLLIESYFYLKADAHILLDVALIRQKFFQATSDIL